VFLDRINNMSIKARPRVAKMSRKKVLTIVLGSIFGAFIITMIVILWSAYSS
jgi:hypothetical protein